MSNEKKSIGKLIIGEWNTRTIVAVAVGAALFGVLMVFGGIQVFTNTTLTTAMIVPVLVGGMFGPVPAMVTLLIGNILADFIGGWGMYFDWSVGNAVMGFCVGLLPVYGANIMEGVFQVKHMIIYAVCCILGNVLAFGVVTPILTTLIYGAELKLTFIQAGVASLSNILILTIVGIPVLILIAKRAAAQSNLKKED
jgi:energy-coupling factor transport system substrate-specific component